MVEIELHVLEVETVKALMEKLKEIRERYGKKKLYVFFEMNKMIIRDLPTIPSIKN